MICVKTFFTAWLAVLLFSSLAFALSVAPDYYYPYGQTQQQAAYYQVFLDDGGRAFVLATIDLLHYNDQPLNEFTLTFPDSLTDVKYAMQYSQSYGQMRLIEVQKISDNTYKILLEEAVQKQQASTVVIYYRSLGYVSKGWLTYDFDFRTISFPFDIQYSRVAVSVDSEFHVKGQETRTDYGYMFGVLGSSAFVSQKGMVANAPEYAGERSKIADFAQRVRYAPGYVRDKQMLEAGDVFHVTGSYAKDSWRFYVGEAVIVILILVILGYLAKQYVAPKISAALDSMGASAGAAAKSSKARVEEGLNFGRAATLGMISAFLLAILINVLFILFFLWSQFMESRIYFGGGNLFFLLAIAIGLLGFFAVLVLAGNRFGWGEGIVAALTYFGFSILVVPFSFMITMLVLSMMGGRYGMIY